MVSNFVVAGSNCYIGEQSRAQVALKFAHRKGDSSKGESSKALVFDNFAGTVDETTACSMAHSLQRLARQKNAKVLIATTQLKAARLVFGLMCTNLLNEVPPT